MLAVLSITAPIFLLIGLGYLAVKVRLMPQEAIPGLGRFVLYFALPALMFSTISRMDFGQVIEPNYLSVYALGSLLALLIGIGINKLVLRKPLIESGVMGIGMSIPNSAFIGFPILLQVFDTQIAQAFALSIMVENILILPLALIIIESGRRSEKSSLAGIWLSVFSRIIRNPLIIAIASGLLFSSLSLQLPEMVNQSLDMLARASAATALFVIGGSLVGTQIRGNLYGIGTVVSAKLLLHPLLVAFALWLWPPFDSDLEMAVLLIAAMPMMSIFPIIGSSYGLSSICASILLLTTVTSFFTITALLSVLT
ncbi:AEC family transporter [Marinobacterium sp. YM272]|uniref:AEC family transporter n=1 Tax=Marinobacterium sp. YM272 TaxID=3421654 RepID=UPI003D7F7528